MGWQQVGEKALWTGSRPPDIELRVDGLDTGVGRRKGRLRLPSGTRDRSVYDTRVAMIKDLYSRGLIEPLRMLQDVRRNKDRALAALESAYQKLGWSDEAMIEHAKSAQPLAVLVSRYVSEKGPCDEVEALQKLNRFSEFIGENATLKQMTARAINSFLDSLTALSRTKVGETRPVLDSTRNRYRAEIQGFCSWCLREGILRSSPYSIPKAIKRFRDCGRRLPDLEEREIAAYLAAVEDSAGADYRLLMWAHVETGADAIEFHTSGRHSPGRQYHPLTVRACKFVPEPGVARLRFVRSKTMGRGATEREIPVTTAFAEALRAHIDAHGLERDDVVFEMCDYWRAYHVHVAAVARVTTQSITRKDLRHIAAIRWRLNGADLEQVREWLGLVSLSQVKVYAGIRPRDDFDGPIMRRIESSRVAT